MCKYTTPDISNYKKHLKTIAHISLFMHRHEINKKREKNKLLNIISDNVKSIYDEQITSNNNLKSIHDEQIKTSNNLKSIHTEQLKTNSGIKKITDYVNFLNIHCKDAEPLTLLTDDEIDDILELDSYNEGEFEEMIIKYYKSKRLYIKIGESILKRYLKPNNLKQQRIWTSDVSRLIYLILQMVGDEKNWVRDKKGELFTELITRPIITRIVKIMSKYAKKLLAKFDKKNNDSIENAIILDNVQTAENISSKFYCMQVEKDVLKFSASKFSVAVKKEELVEY